MKKLGFIIAFSALFAIGMSAQTTNPPKKTPTPRAAVQTKPQAQVSTKQQPATTTTTTSPAKHTVARGAGGKKRPVKAVPVKPVDATTAPKQKVN
jgi:hypothetical protein